MQVGYKSADAAVWSSKGRPMAADTIGQGGGAVPRASADPQSGLSIVVPLHNEANSLSVLHARIIEQGRALRSARNLATEVVYVDDGSSDATLEAARALAPMASMSRSSRCHAISARR